MAPMWLRYMTNGPEFDFPPFTGLPPVRYVLASTPRSGSNMLARALWHTGVAGFAEDYFADEYVLDYFERWGFAAGDEASVLERYVQQLMTVRTSPNGAFGVKVHAPHLRNLEIDVHDLLRSPRYISALTRFPDVAKVTPVTTQNGVGLIKVIPESGPSDSATATLVHAIRDDRAAVEGQTGAHILVGGTTASNIDVSAKLSAALPIFLIAVVGLAFVLLTFAFRTILVPVKSILGFLLSMAAALGAQVAMFQWGWGQHLLGITPSQTISFLPIIMLAIIFGLSSDYEVFVVSRIKEDYTRNGDARRAVQRGTGQSARVVTAAMIMFSIFVAFMFTSDPTIKAIGFSFAAGVFLDAFLVRLTLVPAVMAIAGSRLWYHPQWFARHIPDPDIEGQRLAHKPSERNLAAAATSARQG